jgi:hypothetical protein
MYGYSTIVLTRMFLRRRPEQPLIIIIIIQSHTTLLKEGMVNVILQLISN